MGWAVGLLALGLPAACTTDDDAVPPGTGGRLVPVTGGAGPGGASSLGGAAGATTAGQGGTDGPGGSGAAGEAGGGAGEAGAAGDAGMSGSSGHGGDAGTGGSAGATAGAGGSSGSSGQQPTAPEDKAATLAHLTDPCTALLDGSFYGAATAPAPWAATHRGDLVRCGYDRLIGLDEIKAHLVSAGQATPTVFSAIHKLRVVYWSEGDDGKPALTSAILFVPEQRLAAGPAPLVVLGHGSVGVADVCAPSREDAAGFHQDWRTLAYSLVGQGWLGLMPDYIGLGTPGSHAWLLSSEEAHALLDAPRAAHKLFKSGFLGDRSAIVGHSQGGHAAISAHALAGAYGTEGKLTTVVAHAPIWFSEASWGASLTSIAVAIKANSASALASSAMYFAGHLGRLSGESTTLDPFLPEKQATVQSFLLGKCWQDVTDPAKWPADLKEALYIPADGSNPAVAGKGGSVFYTSNYTSEVGSCALSDSNCSGPLAKTWRQRWVNDRPPPSTTIPLVVWGGDLDTAVAPGRLRCGLDRLTATGAPLTACAAPGATHAGVLLSSNDWVRQHLAHALLDAPAPAACADYTTTISAACATPPANSTSPSDP